MDNNNNNQWNNNQWNNQLGDNQWNYNQNYSPNDPYNQYNQYSGYNNQFTPINANVKRKKPGGFFRFLLKFFLFIFMVIVIFVAVSKVSEYFKNKKLMKEFENEVFVMDNSDYLLSKLESLKSEQSDIEGWTKYEKIEKGLNPDDGSDTDGDGLTDKEEIEIYHSDPLLISTSGDGIPDSYKVQNNLDVKTKYNVDKVGYQGYNQYSNIEIKDKTSKNALISISEIDGYKVQGVEAEKVYSIVDYDGKVTLDFSDYINGEYSIFKKNDEAGSEYEILKDKNGSVTVDTKGKDCVIGVINLSNSSQDVSFNSMLFESNEAIEAVFSDSGDTIFVVFPLLSVLQGEAKIYMFEKSSLSFGNMTAMNRKSELIHDVVYEWSLLQDEGDGIPFNVIHSYISPYWYNWLKTIIPLTSKGQFLLDLGDADNVYVSEKMKLSELISVIVLLSGEFPSYSMSEGYIEILKDLNRLKELQISGGINTTDNKTEEKKEDGIPEKRSRYVTGFDVTKDALPFSNIGTYISAEGNCAGFSMITAQLYNNHIYPKTDSGTFKDTKYSYDITNMKYFSTFFDRYLYDYKELNYWTDNYPDMENISRDKYPEEDRLFLDFLGFKQVQWNANTNQKIIWFNGEHKWSEFEKVISYFENNNEILCLGMSSGGSGHAVNAYGLRQDMDNPNIWYVKVYDSNFPKNQFRGNAVNPEVKIVRKNPLFGEDYFEFDYYPVPKLVPSYRFTSYGNITSGKGAVLNTILTVSQAHVFFMSDDRMNPVIGAE